MLNFMTLALVNLLWALLVADTDWQSFHLAERGYWKGDLLILLSCGGSASYSAFSKRLLHRFNPN